MSTDIQITVNGRPVESIEAALQAAPTDRYLIVRDGTPVDSIMWDGVSPFDPGDGAEIHREADWQGAPYAGPEEAHDVKARRSTTERLDALLGNLRDDIKAFDAMTAQQRQAAQKRTLRAVILLARVVRDDHAGEVE